MTGQLAHNVLRRMATPPPPVPEDVPITSSRAIRLAITRAADKTHDMVVNVNSLQEEVLPLDELLGTFAPDLMLLAMMSGERVMGLAAVGSELRAALMELQTIGRVLGLPAEDRAPTRTDARMSEPLLTAFFAHLQETAAQTPLDGWGHDFVVGEKLESTRAAGLVLDDGAYQVIRISLDLGIADRVSELSIALPNRAKAVGQIMKTEDLGDWDTQFKAVIDGSPAQLTALLHRFKLPLYQADNLSVGQGLPLPGCTVSSVKLLAVDGQRVATARLGQSGGMRAVRIEAAPHLQMEDMDNLGTANEISDLSPMGGANEPVQMGMKSNRPTMSMQVEGDDEPVPMELSADGSAAAVPLSWDGEDLSAESEPEEANALDWSNEDFETPAT